MPSRDLLNYPVYGMSIPAREISGDFYDFYFHDDQVYFTLSDVSGKGVNAGMVMAKAITLFKIFARQKFKPNEILFEMNNDLKQTNPSGTFVTSIVGLYNMKTDIVELSNAGHQPALYKKEINFKEYNSSSTPLGLVFKENASAYKLEKFKLDGGRIYCFTDGFSESKDDQNKEIGIDGVKKLISDNQNSSLKKELKMITNIVRQNSLKKNMNKKSINDLKDMLDDDLTIIGLGNKINLTTQVIKN